LTLSYLALPGRQDAGISLSLSTASSPRRSYLHDAGRRTIANGQLFTLHRPSSLEVDIIPLLDLLLTQTKLPPAVEPFATFLKTFSAYDDLDLDTFQPLLSHFVRVSASKGHVLWKQGDESDGLYLIESGVLRASYQFADYAPPAEESMVPGTLAGELTALSGLARNATVVVEKPCVAWKLTVESLRQLERENPILTAKFIRLVLKCERCVF
jgi:sulfate permease, SulP family